MASITGSGMGLWSPSHHRASVAPTYRCGRPEGWDGREKDGYEHRPGPTSCINLHAIHFSLKCGAEDRGIAALPGVSPGLGFMLQLPEALSLVGVNSQHLLPPTFKKTTDQMSDFQKCLHSDPVFSLHLGQGELILHTYRFHQSSKKKQDEKRPDSHSCYVSYSDTL